ncbi:Protein O-mannosyl-transferase TMTC3 (Protein SMILE) (Transmembrane and TPR repeat-containing protein 3), partial [Durusdinium trenchii]
EAWEDVAQVLEADFWGTPLVSEQSHKSFRPITTASFKVNLWGGRRLDGLDAYWFHVVDRVLHALVTLAVVVAADLVLSEGAAPRDGVAAVVTGLTFALHPVHTEAVCNTSGRAETLMAAFYLCGVIASVRRLHVATRGERNSLRFALTQTLAVVGWTVLALFSKEQGITLPMTCAVIDFCASDISLRSLLQALRRPDTDEDDAAKKARTQDAQWFAARTAVLALATLTLGAFRLWLNGGAAPNFIPDQNPAAFAQDWFTRVFSIAYVHFLYLQSFVLPVWLSCDWSGKSIALITSPADPRVACVLATWAWFACSLWFAFLGPEHLRHRRKQILQATVAFLFIPFLLSSNLIVTVGTMKAERVLYLPSVGFCMLLGVGFEVLVGVLTKGRTGDAEASWVLGVPFKLVLALYALLALYAVKLHERNIAWSDPFKLWKSAYETNPISSHSRYNFALELTQQGDFERGLELILSVRKDDPHDIGTIYLEGLTLRQLNRCPEASKLADETMAQIGATRKERAASGLPLSIKEIRRNLDDEEALMLTLKSYCATTLGRMSQFVQDALLKSPGNAQARGRADELINLAKEAGVLN